MTKNWERYARNLPLIGETGQQKLAAAKVLVAGAGGLGSPVLLYLAAAGVGAIGICDGDQVNLSNLNRQLLYNQQEVGQAKAAIARQKLALANPEVKLELHPQFVMAENVEALCRPYDLVVDCLDNLAARYLLNDACVAQGKPLVHGGVSQFYGQQMTVQPGGPCLRCALPPLPADEQGREDPQNGVLGAVAGVVGSMQALAVLKLILGLPVESGYLYYYDFLNNDFDRAAVAKDPQCLGCGKN